MPIGIEDIELLRKGQPPEDSELLKEMTLGGDAWLDFLYEHYLENHILDGGSKVKVLVGAEGSGKTHLIRNIQKEALDLGYQTVYISLYDMERRVSDIVNLYKRFAASIDRERLAIGLCQRVGKELGYSEDQYDGKQPILPILVEKEGLNQAEARREIRIAVSRIIRNSDLSPSFNVFTAQILNNNLIGEEGVHSEICWKWFAGEKLEPLEKRATKLYDRLTRANARVWLYSLIRLVRLSGSSGVVLLIDNLEATTQRVPETNRYRYTPNAIKDTCELFRQLIDAAELLEHFFVVMAGRPEILTDEHRGLKSYEALWMRLQTGLVPSEGFNRYADIIDTGQLIKKLGGVEEFAKQVDLLLREIIQNNGFQLHYREIPPLKTSSLLRKRIAETAFMIEQKGGEDADI